jgi:hypothetical protein
MAVALSLPKARPLQRELRAIKKANLCPHVTQQVETNLLCVPGEPNKPFRIPNDIALIPSSSLTSYDMYLLLKVA